MKAFPSEWTEFYPSTTGSSHVSNAQTIKHSEGGMDLRDYFAAKAMQSLANAWAINKVYPSQDIELAECAYQVADAMMKARK